MKKIIKTVVLAAATVAALGITSCNKNNGTEDAVSEKDKAFKGIAEAFLDNTVYPTYKSLADYTEVLVENLSSAKSLRTDAAVKTACNTFLLAREQWELSEAFLFGAASDFGIDPHIDSWPLDEAGFNRLMNSPEILAALDAEDGDVYAGENLGNALLGFHGIEYILFEDGQPKAASKITDDQYIYAVAVAGDLRNRTAQLDAAWRGKAAGARLAYVEDELELNTTVGGGDYYYGENLLLAGEAGSTFRSWTHAMQSIIQASVDIADEVGTSKIGKAYTNADPSYIESPYSYNSINDFYNNITSIVNVYYGGIKSSRDESNSLHAYFKKYDSATDTAIVAAIDNALAKIQAMPYPFVNNKTDAANGEAMEALSDLVEVLEKAIGTIAQL